MKILYKQPDNTENCIFNALKLTNTYLKQLSAFKDNFGIANKGHHHTCFEIHMVSNGYQTYCINDKNYKIDAGSFLLIPPHTKHKLVDFSKNAEKFSITFITENPEIRNNINSCRLLSITERMSENLKFIFCEYFNKLLTTARLTENALFETVILILRQCGVAEEGATDDWTNENTRLALAKQYIKDNIELSPTVDDVAKYCNLSPRQLTRSFLSADNITPLSYIQKQKIKLIQKLLADGELTLKEISEKLNFNNEYYFNSFFKKYAGMPPGEYRTMHK